jgi:hypothetical protein
VRIDAIVNAANTSLLGGGGVTERFTAKAARPAIPEECPALRASRYGTAKRIHQAGDAMPSRITVGTIYESCRFHPVLCTELYDDSSITEVLEIRRDFEAYVKRRMRELS